MNNKVFIELANSQWGQLHNAVPVRVLPEMMMAKKGQLLTPPIRFAVRGLDAQTMYTARIIFQRVADFHYKWNETLGTFLERQSIEPALGSPLVDHPAGPQLGAFWLSQGIDFSMLKLVNKSEDVAPDTVLLESKCQYWPRLQILEMDNWTVVDDVIFEEQRFIVVTGHQNKKFVAMKKAMIGERKVVKRKAEGEKVSKKVSKRQRLQEIDEASDEDLDALLQLAMHNLPDPKTQFL